MRVDERMIRARMGLITAHPFWGVLAMYLEIIEDPSIETMQTNGKFIKYNPAFLDTLSELETEGVIAHEVAHCAYGHMTRRGKRRPDLWNEAADYAINRDLVAAKFTLPSDALLDARFNGLNAEEIYAILEREDDGKPRQSSCGEVVDATDEGNQAEAASIESEWQVRTLQAVSVEKMRNAGTLPEELTRIYETITRKVLDWRSILLRFIDERSRVDYSWSRPNKRMLGHGFIVPGMVPDGINHIGLVIDTSASIDQKALSLFMNELQAALDYGTAQKFTVISCDTAVRSRKDFYEGDKLDYKPIGGGGTRFSPALEWFEKNEPEISALIYFTDLECNDFGRPPWVPLLWIGYGSPDRLNQYAKNVPFGEVIPLIN